jgi:hypothetical protein|tara:strand:+ start:557 stop:910 length:354 start_codon:yes stop_codon:yes gene_type:complete
MRHAFLALLLFSGSASAQSITPAFTQGSMQATTTTTQTIEETIAHEVYGSAVTSYSGENVTPSSNITDSSATWSITTAGDPWTLEITERSAGIVETIDIERTIETDSTTTSLSVFSQ